MLWLPRRARQSARSRAVLPDPTGLYCQLSSAKGGIPYAAPVSSPSNTNGEGSLVPIPTRKVGQVPLSILAYSVSHHISSAHQVSVMEIPTYLHSLDAHACAHARSRHREHGHVHGHANARDRGSARRARAAAPRIEWTRWSGRRM
jgi:hypothetical protein